MAGKSMLDQILDTLEKWEGESSETRVPEDSPASAVNASDDHTIAKEEKVRLFFWTIVCVAFITIVPFIFIPFFLSEVAGRLSETISITAVILCYIIYFSLFFRALSRYLTLSHRGKGWLWVIIHPFIALSFVIYWGMVDKSVTVLEQKKLSETKKTSEIPSSRFQQKKSFFDFTSDDRFKR